MSNNQKQRLSNKLDDSLVKNIIKTTFVDDGNVDSLAIRKSDGGLEVKLFDDRRLYSVSIITAKHCEDVSERWLYNVLSSNSETNEMVWRYVHPITNVAYKDPSEVDYKTLPFVS